MAEDWGELLGDVGGLAQVEMVGEAQVLHQVHVVRVQMLPRPCRVCV